MFSLVNSAVNTSLPAFAAERRAAAQLLPGARRSPLSIDTSCPHVGRSAANSIGARRYWRSSDGTGTDGSARDRCAEPAPLTGRSVLVTCTGENVGRPVGPYTSDASAHAAARHRKTSSVDRSRRRVQNVQSRRRGFPKPARLTLSTGRRPQTFARQEEVGYYTTLLREMRAKNRCRFLAWLLSSLTSHILLLIGSIENWIICLLACCPTQHTFQPTGFLQEQIAITYATCRFLRFCSPHQSEKAGTSVSWTYKH